LLPDSCLGFLQSLSNFRFFLQVEAANPLQPSLPIATVIPEEGEDIFVVSSPSGLEGIVTNGLIVGFFLSIFHCTDPLMLPSQSHRYCVSDTQRI
jgi:hypothetical protein